MLQTRVEIREALHLHGQMLRHFIQWQETSLWHCVIFEIFADLYSDNASDCLVESSEGVEGGLFVVSINTIVRRCCGLCLLDLLAQIHGRTRYLRMLRLRLRGGLFVRILRDQWRGRQLPLHIGARCLRLR